jgi:hypothetical protein
MSTDLQKRIYPPLDHYDYSAIDTGCCCTVCEDQRIRLIEMTVLVVATADHHRICKCKLCKERKASRTAYFAAVNRRDLYSESSYHAKIWLGESFMTWITSVLEDKQRSDGWWMLQAPWKHMGNWFLDYSRSQANPSVSGGVA